MHPFTEKVQDYHKTRKKRITLLDMPKMIEFFGAFTKDKYEVFIGMERPKTNEFVMSNIVAARVHQQYLDLFAVLELPYPVFIDSKSWQKKAFPAGVKGPDLKHYSREIGCRKWPQFTDQIMKQKNRKNNSIDADGLFISEWLMNEHRIG
jgi:hypothetical protein